MERAAVLAVGDLILGASDAAAHFDETRSILSGGDVVIGQIETPHTNRPHWSNGEAAAAGALPPERLSCLRQAGFDIITGAGNHVFDQGENGVLDTIDALQKSGVLTAGFGADLAQARRPARMEKNGIRFACLEYNCNGPREAWATPAKAGGAFIRVVTAYVNDSAEIGGLPTAIYTIADPASMEWMRLDIEAVRAQCDIVICAFHLGRMGSEELLQCQTEITHRAIDWGTDIVVCHHAHTLQGIERYRGRPIFYNLGNFVTTAPDGPPSEAEQMQRAFDPTDWQGVRPPLPPRERKPFVAKNYPFDQRSRHTGIAKIICSKEGVVETRFIPCWINDLAHPVPVTRENGGEQAAAHLRRLNELEGLKTDLRWDETGTELIVL